jgi:phenylpropionate dioxygenase-like ring-hydroxylating dioxygenase large terminal subunit
MGAPSITIYRGDTSRLKNQVPIAERFTAAFHEEERKKIFARAWLPAASALDVPNKGDYTVVEVPPMKTTLIVVRGDDNKVRAFHNVCRHRGDRLIHLGSGKEQGCRKAFTCGFHAWTYSNTGKLIGVTDESQFPGLDRDKHGLIPVHAEEWESLVFVNFEKTPHVTLREWLGDFYDQYKGFSKGREKIAEHRLVLKTNWNIAVNAFSEGYHNLYIHRNTVPDYQGGTDNPQRHRPFMEVGAHFGRYSAHANFDHHQTPAEAVIYKHTRKLFPSFSKVDPQTLAPGVNPSRFPQWAFDIVPMFPHFVMGPQANAHSHMFFWPIDHEHTEIRIQRYAYKAESAADRVAQAYSKVRGREVLREDLATMEASLAAISSGALPHIVLSQQEMLIQNHYRAADEMLARD